MAVCHIHFILSIVFRIIACLLVFFTFVILLFFFSPGMKKEKNVESKEQDEESCKKRCLTKCPLDWDLLRNLKFELFALTSAVNWSSTYLVHLLIVDFAEERGFSLSQGASLLTMVGIAALLSRALAGVLKMIRRVKSVTWYIIFGLIASVIHACLPLNKRCVWKLFSKFYIFAIKNY